MQIAAGAIGVTCAKLGEAEVMAAAGIRDILIANQIVGHIKIDRLVQLADRADPIVCVDSIENLAELDAAFTRANKRLRVAIEVDIGMNRAGVEPGAPVVAFAHEIASRPGLRFVGVAGWESQATTIADPAEKERTVRRRRRRAHRKRPRLRSGRPQRRGRELWRHRYLSLLCAATRSDRGTGRRRDFQRYALPHALSCRLCASAYRAHDGNEPANADTNRRRRRQEDDERRCGDAGASRACRPSVQ